MALTSLRNSLRSLKCHSLILRPTLRKSAVVIFRQQFKTFDPKNVLNARFPKCVAHKKAVYTLVNFQIFIHYLNQIGSQLRRTFQ